MTSDLVEADKAVLELRLKVELLPKHSVIPFFYTELYVLYN